MHGTSTINQVEYLEGLLRGRDANVKVSSISGRYGISFVEILDESYAFFRTRRRVGSGLAQPEM